MRIIGKTFTKVTMRPDGTLFYSEVRIPNWAIKHFGAPKAYELYKDFQYPRKFKIV